MIESEREILLWEKRIQLAEEMKATLKGDNDSVRLPFSASPSRLRPPSSSCALLHTAANVSVALAYVRRREYHPLPCLHTFGTMPSLADPSFARGFIASLALLHGTLSYSLQFDDGSDHALSPVSWVDLVYVRASSSPLQHV